MHHDHGPDDFDPSIASCLVNLDALKNTISLKHLTLMGLVFRGENEQSFLGERRKVWSLDISESSLFLVLRSYQ